MDEKKLANAVLFLLRDCAPARPGLTALLKMLFLADYEHYRQHLRPITGCRYVALERGPVLDNYGAVFDRLAESGVLTVKEVPVEGHPEQPKIEYSPAREPDEAALTETELEVLAEVVRRCAGMSGASLTNLTHREGPWPFIWKSTDPGRRIPPMAFRWLDNMPDEADLAEAKKAISRPAVADLIATF